MPSCYVCTVHDDPSPDDRAVGSCTTCGVLTCVYDGARVHNAGRFQCALCLTRVLLRDAGIVLDPGDDGGGGGGGMAQAARAYFGSSEQFERDAQHLAGRTVQRRGAWRELMLSQLSSDVALEFGKRLEDLSRTPAIADRVADGLMDGTVDRMLLADAAGVGEHAVRLSQAASGPASLPSVAAERAQQANVELALQIAAEEDLQQPQWTVVRAAPQQAETKPLKTMTAGGRSQD